MAIRTRIASYPPSRFALRRTSRSFAFALWRANGSLSRRRLPLQPQVHTQQSGPARMMLFVEGQVAAAVRGVHATPHRLARPSAQMGDGGVRCEQDAPPTRPDRRAHVHILGVEEIAFVQEADRFEVGPV